MIELKLQDTPSMRRLLLDLAGHVADDDAPFFEALADNAPDQDMLDACAEFVAVVDRLFGSPLEGSR